MKRLTDIVSGTSTNADALPLLLALEENYHKERVLRLSLRGSSPFSSSFLNSSLGTFMDSYGVDALKRTLVFSEYKESQKKMLVEYIKNYHTLHC